MTFPDVQKPSFFDDDAERQVLARVYAAAVFFKVENLPEPTSGAEARLILSVPCVRYSLPPGRGATRANRIRLRHTEAVLLAYELKGEWGNVSAFVEVAPNKRKTASVTAAFLAPPGQAVDLHVETSGAEQIVCLKVDGTGHRALVLTSSDMAEALAIPLPFASIYSAHHREERPYERLALLEFLDRARRGLIG